VNIGVSRTPSSMTLRSASSSVVGERPKNAMTSGSAEWMISAVQTSVIPRRADAARSNAMSSV
jgi:hypothetical protein